MTYSTSALVIREDDNMFFFFSKKKRQAYDLKKAKEAEAIVKSTIKALDKVEKVVDAVNEKATTYDLAEKFYYATRRKS